MKTYTVDVTLVIPANSLAEAWKIANHAARSIELYLRQLNVTVGSVNEAEEIDDA